MAGKLSVPQRPPGAFTAIDFETADYGCDSACQVALVRVEGQHIVARECRLIRPPRRSFEFTHIHGISWRQVADQPTFGEVWTAVRELTEGVDFLVAQNAPFDRGVLYECCFAAQLPPPKARFQCTVKLARQTWQVFPTKLPDVCRFLQIPLDHHNAASDAEACAKIVLAAWQHTANAAQSNA